MAEKGTIVKVSGPLIVANGMADVQMYAFRKRSSSAK